MKPYSDKICNVGIVVKNTTVSGLSFLNLAIAIDLVKWPNHAIGRKKDNTISALFDVILERVFLRVLFSPLFGNYPTKVKEMRSRILVFLLGS